MDEVKKIGDYSVKYSMYIGHKDIALGENPGADKNERYMCCFVETNAIFERYRCHSDTGQWYPSRKIPYLRAVSQTGFF